MYESVGVSCRPTSPARLGAVLGVAGAVARGSGQRGTQVVGVGFVVDGAEHQAGLEAWKRDFIYGKI